MIVIAEIEDFRAAYISSRLMSNSDDNIRRIATNLSTSKHHLSKIHTKYSAIPTEQERLSELVPVAVYNLKCALIEFDLREINTQIAEAYKASSGNLDDVRRLMTRSTELNNIKKELAKYLGERILSPRIKR